EAQLSAVFLSKSWRGTRPLRWMKIKFYELVLGRPIGRGVSLVRSGRDDCLQKYPVAAIKPASGERGFRKTSDTIVVMADEASRTGAPILAWNLVKKLQLRYNVVVLLRAGGPLFSAFEEEAAAVVSLPQATEPAEAELRAFVEALILRY